jgi:hypothetical protein
MQHGRTRAKTRLDTLNLTFGGPTCGTPSAPHHMTAAPPREVPADVNAQQEALFSAHTNKTKVSQCAGLQ